MGHFGHNDKVQGICVQSMDGRLAFYDENGTRVITRRLDRCLVPGPLAYVPEADMFVTCNSSMEIESCLFQVVAAAQDATNTRRKDSTVVQSDLDKALSSGGKMSPLGNRKVMSDWIVNIGEYALDIRLSRLHLSHLKNEDESKTTNHNENKIVVLGERTLFCITIRGELIYQRRLDYDPICMCTYAVQPDQGTSLHNLILASTESVAFVYVLL